MALDAAGRSIDTGCIPVELTVVSEICLRCEAARSVTDETPEVTRSYGGSGLDPGGGVSTPMLSAMLLFIAPDEWDIVLVKSFSPPAEKELYDGFDKDRDLFFAK